MSAQHTQGRVKVQHPHAGERGWEVAFEPGLEQLCQDITEANARRIAACWNACEGLSIEALEDDAPRKLREDRDLILAQRNELLAALKEVVSAEEARSWGVFGVDQKSPLKQARAAIAKATGEKT